MGSGFPWCRLSGGRDWGLLRPRFVGGAQWVVHRSGGILARRTSFCWSFGFSKAVELDFSWRLDCVVRYQLGLCIDAVAYPLT